MVQREVADRLLRGAGTKAYGAVSVLVQLAAERTGFHPVSRTVFRPPPNVDSALVAFRRSSCRRLRAPQAGRRGRLRPPAQDARRTRSSSPGSRRASGRAGARGARAACRRRGPRRSTPREFVALAGGAAMTRAPAPAKINLALVVGPLRDDGKHEVATVLQRVDLGDRVAIEPAAELARRRLRRGHARPPRARALAGRRASSRAGVRRSRSGSRSRRASAAAARTRRPRSGSRTSTLAEPLPADALADARGRGRRRLPFFLAPGPQLGEGDGTGSRRSTCRRTTGSCCSSRTAREGLDGARSTRLRRAGGADGFEERRAALLDALARRAPPRDLAALPPNDLASLAARRRAARARRVPRRRHRRRPGGLRALPSTGPARRHAPRSPPGRTWITVPAWYGRPRWLPSRSSTDQHRGSRGLRVRRAPLLWIA